MFERVMKSCLFLIRASLFACVASIVVLVSASRIVPAVGVSLIQQTAITADTNTVLAACVVLVPQVFVAAILAVAEAWALKNLWSSSNIWFSHLSDVLMMWYTKKSKK